VLCVLVWCVVYGHCSVVLCCAVLCYAVLCRRSKALLLNVVRGRERLRESEFGGKQKPHDIIPYHIMQYHSISYHAISYHTYQRARKSQNERERAREAEGE
jgi:hypothetical protein